MSAPLGSSGNQPKGRGGDIARYIKIARLRNLIAENRDAAVMFSGRANQEIIEHLLHMVSGWNRLHDCGFASGKQSRKQQCSFHLRARHRGLVTNSTQGPPLDAQRRSSFGTFGNKTRAQLAKRSDHPIHRAF